MNPQVLIQAVLALDSINETTIAAVLGLGLTLRDENPYWAFFEGEPILVFASVTWATSKLDQRWRLTVQYALDRCNYLENALDFAPYGQRANVYLNPDIAPEGSYTHVFLYSGHKLYFEFTYLSHRLLGITIERP